MALGPIAVEAARVLEASGPPSELRLWTPVCLDPL